MVYKYPVKHDGIIYPAGTDVPDGNKEDGAPDTITASNEDSVIATEAPKTSTRGRRKKQ